jgi:hypothetical protein
MEERVEDPEASPCSGPGPGAAPCTAPQGQGQGQAAVQVTVRAASNEFRSRHDEVIRPAPVSQNVKPLLRAVEGSARAFLLARYHVNNMVHTGCIISGLYHLAASRLQHNRLTTGSTLPRRSRASDAGGITCRGRARSASPQRRNPSTSGAFGLE